MPTGIYKRHPHQGFQKGQKIIRNYKEKECIECGSIFKPTNGSQLICSKECRKRRHNSQIKERRHNNEKASFKMKVRDFSNKNLVKDSMCRDCPSEVNLGFHHLRYRYPPKQIDVVTLCKDCHKKEHPRPW